MTSGDTTASIEEKTPPEADNEHLEIAPARDTKGTNLVYEDDDEEPELHARTWMALAAMALLNFVNIFALLGPPAVLSYIGEDLNGTASQTWVSNAISLAQAVLTPLISSASDTFQARKTLMVVLCLISFIGAAIAPGSTSINRLIVAQILIGFGFSTVALAYSVPSEICPRKWRPMVQGAINVAAAFGACTGPLVIGALTKANPHTGWRHFYWIQMGIWGATAACIFFGYRPSKRHTRFDHLSILQKLGHLDLPGFGLLTAGLSLFITGLNLGGGLYSWTDIPTLTTLVTGIATLIVFGVYEWRFTKTGIVSHELFSGGKDAGRTFAICLVLIFFEGIALFSYVVFYPILTEALFTDDPFLVVARGQPWWIAGVPASLVYGYSSTKLRSIRSPLFVAFAVLTAGMIGLTTIQPSDSTRTIVFAGLCGLGFGGPLVLIIAGVQLSTPPHLIATATALTSSTRAVSASIFTAIYAATLTTRLTKYIPSYIAEAVLKAGLSPTSVKGFVGALVSGDVPALSKISGVTPAIIGAGVGALKQAYADSIRPIFIIATSFSALACVVCFFIGDVKATMTYHVDAPVEVLRAKHHDERNA